jgi:hypothetical protein
VPVPVPDSVANSPPPRVQYSGNRGESVSTVEYESEEGGQPKLETAEAAKKPATAAKPGAAAKKPEAKAEEPRPPAVSAVPAQKRAQVYTQMAHQAVNAAELLNKGLHKKTVGKKDPRHLEVSEPSGPSTGGGKRARQSINLVPISGEGGVIMCAWLDVAQRAADIRPYDEVEQQFKKRFGSKFDVTPDEYRILMKDLEGMLEQLGFQLVQFEDEDEDEGAGGSSLGAKNVRYLAAAVAVVVVGLVIMLLK